VLFVPMADPLTSHWYRGTEPSFIGVAVNDTRVPAQTSLLSAVMLTLTGRFGFTVIVIRLLTAVTGHWRFEVSLRLIILPVTNVEVVNVEVVMPVLTPLRSQS
jgi:hypothetical protein